MLSLPAILLGGRSEAYLPAGISLKIQDSSLLRDTRVGSTDLPRFSVTEHCLPRRHYALLSA